MKISIGSDHRGFDLKNSIIKYFENIEWLDVGTYSKDRTDYPIYVKKVVTNVLSNKTTVGIVICGSGIGVSIAANRYSKIYAALSWNTDIARDAKMHDKANVLALPADYIDALTAYEIINVWLNAEFKGARYQKRLEMLDK